SQSVSRVQPIGIPDPTGRSRALIDSTHRDSSLHRSNATDNGLPGVSGRDTASLAHVLNLLTGVLNLLADFLCGLLRLLGGLIGRFLGLLGPGVDRAFDFVFRIGHGLPPEPESLLRG